MNFGEMSPGSIFVLPESARGVVVGLVVSAESPKTGMVHLAVLWNDNGVAKFHNYRALKGDRFFGDFKRVFTGSL